MKLDYLKNRLTNKKDIIPTLLLGVAVVCGVLILIKVTSFFVASARAESIVKRAIEQGQSDQKNLEKHLAESASITDELKKNNLFAPPLAKQHPVKEVAGIFGDQVLINNKWYNVGDNIADAKIVAIGPTSVTISWDGKEKIFLPIQSKIGEGQGGPSRGRAAATNGKESENKNENENNGGPPEVTVRAEGGGPRFGGRGGSEGFMAMRQRFENMSEEERQAFRDRMRQRFARDRGGGGDGRNFGGRGGPGGRRPGGR